MASLRKNEYDVLSTSIFFGSLPENVRDIVVGQSRLIEVDAGALLFREGEKSNAVFAVLEGLLKLTVSRRDGSEVVVETFHAGTSFAEALAFSDDANPVSAVALVKTRVLMAPGKVVQSAIRENPEAFGATISATYVHLHRLIRQIEELKSTSSLERLARYIMARAEADGNKSTTLHIPYEKQTLASLLGIKPETLSRAFRRLEEHGVELAGRTIDIKDRAALERLLGID